MVRNELINLIKASFSQGKKEKEIERSLNTAGWERGDVKDTINFAREIEVLSEPTLENSEKERLTPFWAVMIIVVVIFIGEIFSRLAGFSFIFRLFT
jgi:Ca2+-binding EF-hand superfamily protein